MTLAPGRTVVVRAGPAGATLAKELGKAKTTEEIEVTIVSPTDFFFNAPASLRGVVEPAVGEKIAIPLSAIAPKAKHLAGTRGSHCHSSSLVKMRNPHIRSWD